MSDYDTVEIRGAIIDCMYKRVGSGKYAWIYLMGDLATHYPHIEISSMSKLLEPMTTLEDSKVITSFRSFGFIS
jgi:hypothetical protein